MSLLRRVTQFSHASPLWGGFHNFIAAAFCFVVVDTIQRLLGKNWNNSRKRASRDESETRDNDRHKIFIQCLNSGNRRNNSGRWGATAFVSFAILFFGNQPRSVAIFYGRDKFIQFSAVVILWWSCWLAMRKSNLCHALAESREKMYSRDSWRGLKHSKSKQKKPRRRWSEWKIRTGNSVRRNSHRHWWHCVPNGLFRLCFSDSDWLLIAHQHKLKKKAKPRGRARERKRKPGTESQKLPQMKFKESTNIIAFCRAWHGTHRREAHLEKLPKKLTEITRTHNEWHRHRERVGNLQLFDRKTGSRGARSRNANSITPITCVHLLYPPKPEACSVAWPRKKKASKGIRGERQKALIEDNYVMCHVFAISSICEIRSECEMSWCCVFEHMMMSQGFCFVSVSYQHGKTRGARVMVANNYGLQLDSNHEHLLSHETGV